MWHHFKNMLEESRAYSVKEGTGISLLQYMKVYTLTEICTETGVQRGPG